MSREKKSRKGPSQSTGKMRLSKEKLQEERALKNYRPKKQNGNKAGTRNAIDENANSNTTNQNIKKPKGMGSKKPIDLTPDNKPTVVSKVKPDMNRDLKPTAELKKAPVVSLSPEQELEHLENDQKLLDLIDRHEAGELLTGKDAKYFNTKVERHQVLCELLGLNNEEDEFDAPEESKIDQYLSNDLASEWLDEED
ncbi:GTPase-activating protein [Pseudoalteromonas sp. NBT06-2]|uniref:Der GTPase-activating protein YihI n=1 Tax=Pseudoalteromonas sp. NBT06-2 TaxID=2025950 RepID=UPI000BA717CA|nr:Der GTPase-activating protein YihI [Pseudoalteromonas sp. NBT06-2]PAJ72698.1 GTPase-activating protein [Pseudoalteromonas sp. NBT06-2]